MPIGPPIPEIRLFQNLTLKIHGECPKTSADYIGSGNGLVPSGNKPFPEPMLTEIYFALWYH